MRPFAGGDLVYLLVALIVLVILLRILRLYEMPDQTGQERERLAADLAFRAGQRQQILDGRLEEHDRRLAAINGSIDRTARGLEKLVRKVDDLAEAQRTRDKLDEQRARDAKAAAGKQFSSRQLWLAALAVATPQMIQILTHGNGLH